MANIFEFPSAADSLKAQIAEGVKEFGDIFDDITQAKLIKDMNEYIDMWAICDQFQENYNLDAAEPFSESQLKAIKKAFRSHFKELHKNVEYFLVKIYELRIKQAACDMLHGGFPSDKKPELTIVKTD